MYALEALAFTGLAVLATNFALVPVLVLGLVDGTLAITARGVSRGAIANSLNTVGALREGNAIINALFSASSMIGPVLGGIVTAAAGASTALRDRRRQLRRHRARARGGAAARAGPFGRTRDGRSGCAKGCARRRSARSCAS